LLVAEFSLAEWDAMEDIPQVHGHIGAKPVLSLEISIKDLDVNLIPCHHAAIILMVLTQLVHQLLPIPPVALNLVNLVTILLSAMIYTLVKLPTVFLLMLLKFKLKL